MSETPVNGIVSEHRAVRAVLEETIRVARHGPEEDMDAAFEALAPLEARAMFVELFLMVEELTADADVDALLHTTELPLPEHPREIIEAIRSRNMTAVADASGGGGLEQMLVSLILLIVALQDARDRGMPED